ncbi:uncharacterized protein MELLADRAFT_60535 [Melampsora larici-populina 98AG31]|uniref:Uncharacterized protein n=1 Tax=Melampsora larici-populina (strain 98AG31 / pathotype 3-4-7) TaxID=747676 RepID=F4RBJ2_MELLP|nr:uncharacterized protein MELLADRAFT_60535 [Melampsora larici-populina 98AG31]EGG10350.1 hypothetical protein MELLADRAFT_60535 [Melampsora larici-populina 98AG31]
MSILFKEYSISCKCSLTSFTHNDTVPFVTLMELRVDFSAIAEGMDKSNEGFLIDKRKLREVGHVGRQPHPHPSEWSTDEKEGALSGQLTGKNPPHKHACSVVETFPTLLNPSPGHPIHTIIYDMDSLISSIQQPGETNPSRYLMDLDLISKTIEDWLQSIPMTAGLAKCLEAVTEIAENEMESFKKIASHLKRFHIESRGDELRIDSARQTKIIPQMPSMTPLNSTPPKLATSYKLNSVPSVPETLRQQFKTQPDLSSPTPNMPGFGHSTTVLYRSTFIDNSSSSLLEGGERELARKGGRKPDENESTDRSRRHSARLACSRKKLPSPEMDSSTSSGPSKPRRFRIQDIETAANDESQPPAFRVDTPSPGPGERTNLSAQTASINENGLNNPSSVASPLVADEPKSFWIQKIDLYRSESVQRQAVLSSEIAAIHEASLVLLNALTLGSCTQFDPDELLSHPVTFSTLGQPRIHQQLFTPSKGTIWYQPQIFNFRTISTSSPSKEVPIHERYLWDTIKVFHNPTYTLLERGMHYVLAALVLIGTDADRIRPSKKVSHKASMSRGTRNAITCWQHFKELSSLRLDKLQDTESASRESCIQDLDRFIVSIYTMIETFASIWATTTLDDEIATCTNHIANSAQPDSAEAFAARKEELIKTRAQITISHQNLSVLASFLCSGVKGLMIYPKDKHTLSPLRAINFLLVTRHLSKPGQSVEEPIWKRTQAYIVNFMKAVIQSKEEWVPCELNRDHLAKALFLDFSNYFLAHLTEISSRNECIRMTLRMWRDCLWLQMMLYRAGLKIMCSSDEQTKFASYSKSSSTYFWEVPVVDSRGHYDTTWECAWPMGCKVHS